MGWGKKKWGCFSMICFVELRDLVLLAPAPWLQTERCVRVSSSVRTGVLLELALFFFDSLGTLAEPLKLVQVFLQDI